MENLSDAVAPLSPGKAIDTITQLTERTTTVSERLGNIACTTTEQISDITNAAKSLRTAAEALISVAAELELDHKPAFGDEDSYWTVYRFFCVVNRPGGLFSIEKIWEHLEKNYDMSLETDGTLAATLLDWSEDIASDAETKLGIRGIFDVIEGGFTFAPYAASPIARTEGDAVQPTSSVSSQKPEQMNEEKLPELVAKQPISHEDMFAARFLDYITTRLSSEGDIRQADIKKDARKQDSYLDADHLQRLIDDFVATGRLYKYSLGGGALLSLTPKESAPKTSKGELVEEENDLIRPLDVDLAADILRLFCEPGAQWQQKLDAPSIWKKLHLDEQRVATQQEVKEIRTASRILAERYGLVVVGQEKIGTGGRSRTKSATSSVRRRSSNMMVFKIGIASQQIKEQVQKWLAADGKAGVTKHFNQEPKE